MWCICVFHDVDDVFSFVDLGLSVRTVLGHEEGGLVRELHREAMRVDNVPMKDIQLKVQQTSYVIGL